MVDIVAPPSRRREATRQRLLDAAAEVFAEVGLDAASVEAICERAGFTRGAFYSNFESKEELFLELVARVSQRRVESVSARVRELECEGGLDLAADDALAVVQQVIEITSEDRLNVLLLSEIRIHALRNPSLAKPYLAQEDAMLHSVTRIIEDIAAAKSMSFRLPAIEVARLLLTVWQNSAYRAVMAGADDDQLRRDTSEELARIAQVLVEPVQP